MELVLLKLMFVIWLAINNVVCAKKEIDEKL